MAVLTTGVLPLFTTLRNLSITLLQVTTEAPVYNAALNYYSEASNYYTINCITTYDAPVFSSVQRRADVGCCIVGG
ncbi:hypothetical protein DAPPUDRAFT_310520 [Daphnia pulex]|uniref:Uncharacterized protein n=1 Tax=Daphnia pulex TaxID=6669 RepID=E9FTX0_DAPPU|nr:hypothetical protein DAPPUDRAFT_310520 [Daphnia pulex]|eukprot:EFX89568.1 hypothetical protein DAPPUDRAFT_310520 [Daphnia pulex]